MRKIFFREGVIILADNEEVSQISEKPDLSYQFSSVDNLRKILLNLKGSARIETILIRSDDGDALFDAFTSLFKVKKAAGGLVQNNNGYYLIIRRYSLWDLPKGHIEPGESPEKAAVREVSEECGIDYPRINHFLMHTYHHYVLHNEDVIKITYWYKMDYNGSTPPTPQREESITDVKWVSSFMLEEFKTNTYPSLYELFTYPSRH